MKRKHRAYLAAPLFTDAERSFNRQLAETLEAFMTIYLPQRDGCLLSDLLERGVAADVARRQIFEADLAAINTADIVLAVLDGAVVDEGVSFELGYAYSRGTTCVGLSTDSRRAEGYFKNPMWHGSLERTFDSSESLTHWLVTDFDIETREGVENGRST